MSKPCHRDQIRNAVFPLNPNPDRHHAIERERHGGKEAKREGRYEKCIQERSLGMAVGP